MNNIKTLIVGGSFRSVDGQLLVQKRSWEMLRIFSDHIAHPIFAMHETPMDSTQAYPLPDQVEIIRLPPEDMVSRLARSFRNTCMTDEIEKLLDDGCVVYLRLPRWACWRVFNRAASKGNRIIASLHGDWGESYRHKSGRLALRTASYLLARYVDHAYKSISRKSELLFCTGESLYGQYSQLSRQSVLIANFLHSEKDVRPPDRRSIISPCRILFVGHLEERKGLIYLLESLRLLANEGIENRLKIVGSGPLRARLAQAAEDLGLSGVVEFVDYIQYGPELLEQYRKANIFVLPSISSEGVPKVLMEAMSQGVPVISTDVGSSRYLLGGGRFGLVVPPRNERQLADAIKKLQTDEALRNNLIDNGLEVARNSTRDVQAVKVSKALQAAVPEITGVPAYLTGELR